MGDIQNPGGPLQFEPSAPCAFVVGHDPDPAYRSLCKEPREHYYHSRAAAHEGRFAGRWYSHKYVQPSAEVLAG